MSYTVYSNENQVIDLPKYEYKIWHCFYSSFTLDSGFEDCEEEFFEWTCCFCCDANVSDDRLSSIAGLSPSFFAASKHKKIYLKMLKKKLCVSKTLMDKWMGLVVDECDCQRRDNF